MYKISVAQITSTSISALVKILTMLIVSLAHYTFCHLLKRGSENGISQKYS